MGIERTELPQNRHGSREIAEIRKRAALASLSGQNTDPAAHLRKMTAHPALLIPAYLITLGAAFSSWRSSEYFTPLVLLAISSLMAAYIHLAKKRSRHHSAIIFVVILMTAVFGSLRYFPIF
jgi:lipoprotein signal peptidase